MALQTRGIELTHEEIITCCFHTPQKEVMREYAIGDEEQFKDSVWENVASLIHTATPYPQTNETLREMRTLGYRLAVVTNSRRAIVEPILLAWDMHHLFDTIVTREDVSHGKPEPQMLHQALNTLNSSPHRAVMVGDSSADILAGQRAGVETVAFSPPENHPYAFRHQLEELNPSHIVDSYDALREILLNLR